MKKKVLGLLLAVSAFALTACGSKVTEATSTAVEAADGAVALTEQKEEDTDTTKEEKSNKNTEEETGEISATATNLTAGGYGFTFNGKSIAVGMKMKEIVSEIGEATSVFEAASCAFEGMARQYTYGSIELISYEENGEEICCSIYLNDDMVTTNEGVYIGMSKADMESAYGTDYAEEAGICTYAKGGMELRFTIGSDESIVFIEYALPDPQ